MKNYLKLSFILSVLFFYTSCKKENKSNIKNESTITYSKVDSFLINSNNLNFQDYNNNSLLFFNQPSYDIISYDLSTKREFSFNKLGQSPIDYKSIYSKSLRFVNDSTIGVSSINHINKYDMKGNYVDKIKIRNRNTYAPLYNYKVYNDSILIALLSPQGNPSKKEFYDGKPLFLKANLINGDQSSHFNFPLEGSHLADKDHYFPYIYDNYEQIDESSKTYSFINSNDSNLFSFNYLKMDSLKVRTLELDHYNPLKIQFGEEVGAYENLINNFSNSMILNYLKSDSLEYVIYVEGMKKEDVIEFSKNNKGFPQETRPERTIWINKMINGQKACNDFKLPKKYGFPIVIIEEDTFLTQTQNNEKNDLEGNTTFYIIKLTRNNEN